MKVPGKRNKTENMSHQIVRLMEKAQTLLQIQRLKKDFTRINDELYISLLLVGTSDK